ncbi:MAG: ATP-binding protein, partial [Thermoanaerobaculia bacterium]
MERIGVEVARSGYAGSVDEALALAGLVGYPTIVRPSF